MRSRVTRSFRHHDHGASLRSSKGIPLAFQVLDDARRIIGAEVGEQGRHLRMVTRHDDKSEKAGQARRVDRHHRHQPRSARPLRKATRLCTNGPQGFGPEDRLGNYA